MLIKQRIIWTFLIYLVLFLNLGSSIHHADLFGIHSHSHVGCGHCHDQAHSHSHKSCSHHHHILADGKSVQPDLECSICEFFASYNVTFDVYQLELDSNPLFQFWLPNESVESLTPVQPVARGPPLA